MAQTHRRLRVDTGDGLNPERRSARLSLSVLRDVFGDRFAREFTVRLWDGTEVTASDRKRFVLSVNAPYALRAACAPPLDLKPGRAFVHRIIDIEGDVEYAVASLERAVPRIPKWRIPLLAAKLAQLPREPPDAAQDVPAAPREGKMHSPARDREAIGFHYDLPAAFYRTFLDRNLVYSCGYFRTESDTLDDAQIAKIDHTLRKLRLSPGERLLDVGCGFGALVIRAAERFGAEATGITLSRTQYDEACRRVAERGLEERVSIELRDYRDLDGRQFDKIASVGMVEHVGRERLATYFSTLFRALRPGGLLLNHGIADQGPARRGWRASGFMARYVFPDGDLLPIAKILLVAERAGFEVRDVESLREHYAKTLRSWHERLMGNASAAIEEAGDLTFRIYNLYIAGSAHSFTSGGMNVFQSLLAKPRPDGSVDVPSTADALLQGMSKALERDYDAIEERKRVAHGD